MAVATDQSLSSSPMIYLSSSLRCLPGRCPTQRRSCPAEKYRRRYGVGLIQILVILGGILFGLFYRFPPENRHHVIHRDHEQLVVGLEIDRNRIFGVEQDFVVLPEGKVLVVFDLGRDRDD